MRVYTHTHTHTHIHTAADSAVPKYIIAFGCTGGADRRRCACQRPCSLCWLKTLTVNQ